MGSKLIGIAFGLTLSCLATGALAQCGADNKSQQNAADEAAVRGNYGAGSACADATDQVKSEKKNEDAAARAKAKSDERSESIGQSYPKASRTNNEGAQAR
jgi:hypothetical protein